MASVPRLGRAAVPQRSPRSPGNLFARFAPNDVSYSKGGALLVQGYVDSLSVSVRLYKGSFSSVTSQSASARAMTKGDLQEFKSALTKFLSGNVALGLKPAYEDMLERVNEALVKLP